MEEKLYLCSHCKKYKPAKEFTKSIKNKQDGKCALTKFPMTLVWGNGKKNIYNLSVDRIDSSKGYTKDNIQLVCAAANMMKGYMEYNELIHFCEAIIKNK